MRGKVKYVDRNIWYDECQSDHWKSDVHPVRYTDTFAVLYNGDQVSIDEDDIRSFYGRSRITSELISELRNNLHNVQIEYSEDDDGDYHLDDYLCDLI